MAGETIVLAIEHIVQTPGVCGGRPRLAGRRIPVHTVVYPLVRHRASVEDIAETFSLTPAQVHAALAYYYDHQQEMDALIEAWEHEADSDEAFQRKIDALREAADQAALMTVAEVSGEFGVDPSTVRRAIYEERLEARKASGVWLVRRDCAEKMWKHRRE